MSIERVSCLCLTRKRPKMLYRVIRCFERQNWGNKELVIVYDSDDVETETFLQWHYADRDDIVVVKNERKKPSVGYLRNLSIENATGKYIIQWDDDDYFENNRIAYMHKQLKKANKPAVVINSWYCVFVKKGVVRKSNPYTYEGSIFARRDFMKRHPYPNYTRKREGNVEIGEDTHVIRQIKAKKRLHVVENPSIYYYFIHGNNTCSPRHFAMMFKNSRAIPRGKQVYNELVKRLNKDDGDYDNLVRLQHRQEKLAAQEQEAES